MTYEEARALVTILMVADGLPAPDFMSDERFRDSNGHGRTGLSPVENVVFWLSPPKTYSGDYKGQLVNTALAALEQYIKSRNPK